MDQEIRNKLRNVVTQCRKLLEESISQELEGKYAIFVKKDKATADPDAPMTHLSDEEQAARKDILDHYSHIEARGFEPREALEQLVREIAFTHLNRLCAYKMMEARDAYVGGQKFREAVSRGVNSNGVKFYLADHEDDLRLFETGHQDIAYRHFLDWLGGLLSEEIGMLFNPNDPANKLYPRQKTLDQILELLNSGGIKSEEAELREEWPKIWLQDETIGWVYQYFTPKELRDKARKESQAPRNSYELAFRNQFYTPRYVVEFLSDNTLGRIWYEMRQGDTRLGDECRYMVRRPDEVFLSPMSCRGHEHYAEGCGAVVKLLLEGDEESFPPFDASTDDGVQRMIDLAHCVNGYERGGPGSYRSASEPESRIPHEPLASFSTQELLDYLFMTCRADRHGGDGSVYYERWFANVANEVRSRALSARAEHASQEQLLKAPQFIPHRPKKDPRELKILDPASGSGHFLLYCFDLLLTIYEEAYQDEDLGPALKEDYPTLEDLRQAIPSLILARNLYGIDIDPRSTQIAALALWLRSQRAYQEMGLKKQRPEITRSNIVCAEPMPGEETMLKEFVSQLEPKLLGQLVEVVFDKMKLAGEAGSLLKIEEEIQDAVAKAKRGWSKETTKAVDRKGRTLLFSEAEMERLKTGPKQTSLFDISDITDGDFFEQAETRVLEALEQYAVKAQNGKRLQRRLFADDAMRGFAFVDVCRQRFDAVLMNPPFGSPTASIDSWIKRSFPRTKNDIYAAFVERAISSLTGNGILGVITPRTGFFLSSFQKWREEILLSEARPIAFADLGFGVLDAAKVETAAYCLAKGTPSRTGSYFHMLQATDKPLAMTDALRSHVTGQECEVGYLVDHASFGQIPGSPFAYWVSEQIRSLFTRLPSFDNGERTLKQGLATADDFRFVRAWWEVPPASTLSPSLSRSQDYVWAPIVKAGTNSPFYADIQMLVRWDNNGAELRDFAGSVLRNPDYYFKAGITWPARPWLRGFFSLVPPGALFTHTGMMAFVPDEQKLSVCALLNSDAYAGLLHLLMARGLGIETDQTLKYEVGYLSAVPIPSISEDTRIELDERVARCYHIVQARDTANEVSHSFRLPTAIEHQAKSLVESTERWASQMQSYSKELDEHKNGIDDIAYALYGISGQDRCALEASLRTAASSQLGNSGKGGINGSASETSTALLSYTLGAALGRWDIRAGTQSIKSDSLPSFREPLPVRSPGMLNEHNAVTDYPIAIDLDGIMVDDDDQRDDIVGRVRDVIEFIWKDHAEAIEQEACEILGVKRLRDYFRKPGKGGFWDDHVKRYSKSRRKAPIYWLLQSSKKNYALWLYYHRLDKDMLFKALVNYVEPKIRLEENRLESLQVQKAAGGAKKLDREIEKQEDFLSELRDFEDKLRRAADLHLEPDLNDGVVLNIAPLHELVPWKVAQKYWDELLAGKYEWSSIGKQLRERGKVK